MRDVHNGPALLLCQKRCGWPLSDLGTRLLTLTEESSDEYDSNDFPGGSHLQKTQWNYCYHLQVSEGPAGRTDCI